MIPDVRISGLYAIYDVSIDTGLLEKSMSIYACIEFRTFGAQYYCRARRECRPTGKRRVGKRKKREKERESREVIIRREDLSLTEFSCYAKTRDVENTRRAKVITAHSYHLLRKMCPMLTDESVKEDKLDYQIYAETFKDLVMTTETPFTVGIHGSWGSGKTALMRMIQNELNGEADVKTVWFNAWAYDKEETMHAALIQTIVNELSEENKEHTKDLLKKVGTALLDVGIKTLSRGATSLEDVEKLSEKALEIYSKKVEAINDFRSVFERIVQDYTNNGRLVIFIDDLDRCLPEKAIEVIEAIKLFLNIEGCIFFIAVDQKVIEQGIEVKYKEKNLESSPIKGREYLEKIIQLPFNIPPLREDDITKFIENLGLEESEKVVCVIVAGIEANPRKIKRFLNYYQLLKTLSSKREQAGLIDYGEVKHSLLAKFLIIQLRWEHFYELLVQKPSTLGVFEECVSCSDDDIRKDIIDENLHIQPFTIDHKELVSFIKQKPFFGKIDLDPYIYLSQTTKAKREVYHSNIATVYASLSSKKAMCPFCSKVIEENTMSLFCGNCNLCFHLNCMPETDEICPGCKATFISHKPVELRKSPSHQGGIVI